MSRQVSTRAERGALEARVVQKRKHLLSSSPRQQSHERLERTQLRREESNRDGGKQGKVGSLLAHSVRVALLSVQRERGTVDWTLRGRREREVKRTSLARWKASSDNARTRAKEGGESAALGPRPEERVSGREG